MLIILVDSFKIADSIINISGTFLRSTILNWLSGESVINGLGDRGSIPGRVIPKNQKMVLDTAFLNTQHFKVRIKVKMEQSRERSRALLHTSL